MSVGVEEEKELIRRAAAGEEAAFETLGHRYEKRIYTYALRMTGSVEDAFDVSQEVLMRLYYSLPNFKGESSFSVYVHQITANLCKDFFRAKKRRPVIAEPPEDQKGWDGLLADDRYAPEMVLEQKELRDLLDQGIRELAPNHREVVVLREVMDLTYEEISQALGLDLGTVKSRLARARKRLRVFLRRKGNFGGPRASEEASGIK